MSAFVSHRRQALGDAATAPLAVSSRPAFLSMRARLLRARPVMRSNLLCDAFCFP